MRALPAATPGTYAVLLPADAAIDADPDDGAQAAGPMRKFRRWLGASNWMSEHDDITTIEEIVMHVSLGMQCLSNSGAWCQTGCLW